MIVKDLTDLVRETAHLAAHHPVLMGAALLGNRDALMAAIEREKTVSVGLAVGLDREAVNEVIDVWDEWYYQRSRPASWETVRRALTLRAMGAVWRPECHPWLIAMAQTDGRHM